jgi:hypothetical protein
MNFFYTILLSIFLIKEPFDIYLLLGDFYKVLYALSFIIGFAIAIQRAKAELYLVYYLLIFVSIILSIIPSILVGEVQILLLTQFVVSILLLFIIFALVRRVGNWIRILKVLNFIAVTLSFMALIQIMLLYLNLNILPIVTFYPDNASDGLDVTLPLGILKNGFDVGLLFYKSYSYFSEPANFAFFITPFIFYNLILYVEDNKRKNIINTFIIVLALFSTQSVAGVLVMILSYIAYIYLFGSKLNMSINIILMVAIMSIFITSLSFGEYIVLDRMFDSFLSRVAQWQIFYQNIVNNPFGIGIGNYYREASVYNPYRDTYLTHKSVTNILINVQYFGILFIIPLLLIFYGFLHILIKLYRDRYNYYSRILFMMIFSSSIYFISINLIFSPIFLLYISIFMHYYSGCNQPNVTNSQHQKQ